MKVGLVNLSPYGGKIKFVEAVEATQVRTAEFKFYFPAKCTQVQNADFHKMISLLHNRYLVKVATLGGRGSKF